MLFLVQTPFGFTSGFIPSHHAFKPALQKRNNCFLKAVKKENIPETSFFEIVGQSPYINQIDGLLRNDKVKLNWFMGTSSTVHSWKDDIAAAKGEETPPALGKNPKDLELFWNLIEKSVEHALENLTSKFEVDVEDLRLSLRVERFSPGAPLFWHQDPFRAHLICNLFGDHNTIYRGPATCGKVAESYYHLPSRELEKQNILEASTGQYILTSQAAKGVCHSGPTQGQKSGRIFLAIFVGPQIDLPDLVDLSEPVDPTDICHLI